MQDNRVRIGTITANYNNGKYFPECFEGLMKQTRRPNIITVIDDGSTDNSWEVIVKTVMPGIPFIDPNVNDYSFKNNGIDIHLFKMPQNGGPAAARNVGLHFLLNKADVIQIADSDDILYPDKIKKSVDIMLKYPQIGLVYSDYDTLNMQTGVQVREYKEPFSLNRLTQECIVSNNSMFVTGIVKQIGPYDETLRGPEDYDLWLRITEISAGYHIPEALYKYRLTGNNITTTTPSERFSEHVQRVHLKTQARRNASPR